MTTHRRHTADDADVAFWNELRDDETLLLNHAPPPPQQLPHLPRRDPGQTIRDAETALREQYQRGQLAAAERFLAANRRTPGAEARAAVILRAGPWAPEIERVWGIWAAPVEAYGTEVTCRTCGRVWTCIPEDTCYMPAQDGTGGVCFGCALAVTRPDIALPAEPVLEGVVVPKRRGGHRARDTRGRYT
jgi:hypothetical protein